MNWGWLGRNTDVLAGLMVQHVRITLLALAIGVAVSFPLSLAAHRRPRLYPWILAATSVLYTVPSLALFVFLIYQFGLNEWPVIVGLALYSLAILVRNTVEGLRAVPASVTEAAEAMGYPPVRRLFAVELPLAVPVIAAGLRVAAVSTISLVTVGALVGTGALGQLFTNGFLIGNTIEVLAGIVLIVALAVVADLLIVAAQRLGTPWVRAGTTR